MNDIDKRIEYTCQLLDVVAIDYNEAIETIKSIITEQQEVIRQYETLMGKKVEGEGEQCDICKTKLSHLAGNPSKWPVCAAKNGVPTWFCNGCTSKALALIGEN